MLCERHRRWSVLVALLLASSAGAQQRDTAVVRADTVDAAAELRPPLSPRKAFVYSLLVPGYAQSVLGRGRSGTLLMTFETVALVMIRESATGVREARRNLADSLPVSYVDGAGVRRVRFERTAFPNALLRSRKEQLEDWIAVLIANHLFAAADAYVAALLWDLPAEIALRASPRNTGLALRLYW
jgi:hypothetical protein